MNRRQEIELATKVAECTSAVPTTPYRFPCERCGNLRQLVVGTALCKPCVHGSVLADRIDQVRRLERIARGDDARPAAA
jgi:hypothetical protein